MHSFRPDRIGYYRTHGFRFSLLDGMVIIACAVLAGLCWRPLGEFALIFPITLVHFFLFCNVFRVRRALELVWAGIFVANIAAWVLVARFGWDHVLWVQTPVTLTVILITIRSSRYHGVFSSKPQVAAEVRN